MLKFTRNYNLSEIKICDDEKKVLEIAAALISTKFGNDEMVEMMQELDHIVFQGDIKMVGDGLPCSNFRRKDNYELNNITVINTQNIMNMNKPIVMSSYPRTKRYISLYLNGIDKYEKEVVVLNNKIYDETKTIIINKFMELYDLNTHIVKLRESCIGSKYYTYLADCMSFILNMMYFMNEDIFETRYYECKIYNGTELESVIVGGVEWTPDPNHTYIYHNPIDKQEDRYKYIIPTDDSINIVYKVMFKLFETNGDNSEKKMVREYFKSIGIYMRWSDYWVNDVDDGFTIWMIHNAYNINDLNVFDKLMKERIELIMSEL